MTGLSFDLTEEQEQLRQTVRDFADRECPKDVARRLEASEDFPEDLARRIAKAGLNGIGIPEEYGGQGGDLLDQTIVCEELSRTLGGLAWLWGITVWSGARAVLHHGSAAQKERYLPAVAAGDLSRLTTVINVGTPERMRYMQDRLPTAVQISCTGSTEGAGFVCVGDPADPPEARALYAGRPVAGMEARVVDPQTGADLPDHTPGEFVFRGVSRFARYYRDPRTTAMRIDDDGWYHSGDLLERDEQGRFRFHSRLSDVLKVGGENVAAAEIEDRIAGLPGVAVVQVVAAPDGHYGEVAAAFIELGPGVVLTEEEVVGHCLEQMATFKVPRYVRFVTEWPMSGTKIQKARLRQRIADELAAASVTQAPRLTRPAAQA